MTATKTAAAVVRAAVAAVALGSAGAAAAPAALVRLVPVAGVAAPAEAQAAHHALWAGQAAAGKVWGAGPLDGGGMAIVLDGASVAEAQALAAQDPLVAAGALRAEVLGWAPRMGKLAAAAGPGPDGHGDHGGHGGHGGPGAHGAHGDHATVSHRFDDVDRWVKAFDDPSRDAWQKPAALVAALGLRPGQVVADVGAGTGYLLPHLARAVGKKGAVIASDIEPTLVAHLRARARAEGLRTVDPRLGQPGDPALLPNEVDLVVMLDVYHHIDGRVDYLRRLAPTLRPGGRVAIVDFKDGDLPVGPPPSHRIPAAQVDAELEAAGYRLLAEPDVLPHQFIRIYGRAAAD